MKITVAAFYADQPGRASRFADYLPLALASRGALERTNPGARFVVLTDSLTALKFAPYEFECAVTAPEHMLLMPKVIFAQRAFLATCEDADLIVLPDIDCLANRALADAIPTDVGLVVTHKGAKFRYEINNLAYVRDRELGHWFLNRAYSILEGWPSAKRDWGGDQEAWGAVLGDPTAWLPAGEDRFIGLGPVHVYPCATHNCPLADNGAIKRRQREAYFVHLKGPRKQHLARFMAERFDPD
jgi:hypothetical protein